MTKTLAPLPGALGDSPEARGEALARALAHYDISADFVRVRSGPVVSSYELALAPGTRQSRVEALEDDIARAINVKACRVARVPGTSNVACEVPNAARETFKLADVMKLKSRMRLPLALGLDVYGKPYEIDLARCPHLLIAGATGMGKSVAMNAMLIGLMTRRAPDKLRLVLIDPKRLEFTPYNGVPHLLTPVVTDPGEAVAMLQWACEEMESRYAKLESLGVRSAASVPDMPSIVIVIDEVADLMITAGKEVESAIMRLAQLGRAASVHLIVATQRPSADVLTGTIKANLPVRIAMTVASSIDSRVILGATGAEKLVGNGDMLLSGRGGALIRLHGPWVSDADVAQFVAANRVAPQTPVDARKIPASDHTGESVPVDPGASVPVDSGTVAPIEAARAPNPAPVLAPVATSYAHLSRAYLDVADAMGAGDRDGAHSALGRVVHYAAKMRAEFTIGSRARALSLVAGAVALVALIVALV